MKKQMLMGLLASKQFVKCCGECQEVFEENLVALLKCILQANEFSVSWLGF